MKAGADHSVKNSVSMVQYISSSFDLFYHYTIIIQVHLCHYSMVTHLSTEHQLGCYPEHVLTWEGYGNRRVSSCVCLLSRARVNMGGIW